MLEDTVQGIMLRKKEGNVSVLETTGTPESYEMLMFVCHQ